MSAFEGASYLPQAEAAMATAQEWLRSAWRTVRHRAIGASRKSACVVLIDGDNVPARVSGAIIEFASSIGLVRRIEVFANFASPLNTGWAAQMREHGITGVQLYRTSPGKNAADAALIVRAMDILFHERVDDFVLVTSDSDFSPLAHRARRSGVRVHGVGLPSAPAALRQSCTSFQTFEELRATSSVTNKHLSAELWSLEPEDAEDLLLVALVQLGGARAWTHPEALGQEIRKRTPLFDPRSYSCRTLTELCSAIASIEVDRSSGQPLVRIARRPG